MKTRLLEGRTAKTAIAQIATGVALLFSENYAEGVTSILTGLGFLFLRDGVRKVEG